MKKYRIVKHTYERATFVSDKGQVFKTQHTCYEVQKRFLGFLWWYNFNNIDGNNTGIYEQLWEAQDAINQRIHPNHQKQVVIEY